MPKHHLRAAMLIAIVAVVVIAYEESQVQQSDPGQQGSDVSGALRSEGEGAVRHTEATAPVESGNSNALAQTNLSALCTTRGGRSPNGSARIGDFTPPDDVPDYEILPVTVERERASQEGARAAELLVDTRAKSEADYALIARDIKIRYSEYDVVTVQFTDLSVEGIPYNGGALIFNSPCGALYLGCVYGPPNRDGYVLAAGAPPALYPSVTADTAETRAKD
jgi:hypothetical protein